MIPITMAKKELTESEDIGKQMRKEYEKKAEDVRGSVNGLREEFDRRADEVRDAAENLREEYEKRVDEVHAQLDQSMADGKKIVQDHPALVVGVTLVVGIIAGLLLSRKRAA